MKELTTLKEIRSAVKNKSSFCVTGRYAKAIGKLKVFQKKNRNTIFAGTTNNIVVEISGSVWIAGIITVGIVLAIAIVKNYDIDVEVDPETKKPKVYLKPTNRTPNYAK